MHYEGGSDEMRIPIIDSDPIIHELGDDLINLGYWMQENASSQEGGCF